MKQRIYRSFLVIAAMCVVGVIASAAWLRVRQHEIRVHAQRTLNDIQKVEIGTSHVCEIFSEWQKQWGTRLSWNGACDSPDSFQMEINARTPQYLWPTCFESYMAGERYLFLRPICASYRGLSGTPLALIATINGANGIVTRKVSQVFIVVPDEDPAERAPALVVVSAFTDVRFPTARNRQLAVQQQALHPSYRVLVGSSRVNSDYMPGAKIFYIEAEAGPDVTKADSEKLFRFDLSCVTGWHPCSRRELMPAAYQQFEVDAQRSPVQHQ